jgi:hypothetical protein
MVKTTTLIISILGIVTVVFFITSYFQKDKTQNSKVTTPAYANHDINHDGQVNFVDTNYFTQYAGCKNTDPCWKKQITKTFDGDNPVYVYDLDLDKNGIIDAGDAQ